MRIVFAGTPDEVFQWTDAFQRSNIDPPVLTELFNRLRQRGLDVHMPITVDQAVDDLSRLLKKP